MRTILLTLETVSEVVLKQEKLIELVAIFRQNNMSFNYGRPDIERNVSESLPLTESLVNALRRNGVESDIIEASLKYALAPHARTDQLPRDYQGRLIEMIKIFHTDHPSFGYGQSDYTRSVHESLFLTESLINALRRHDVDSDVIQRSLQQALAPHYPSRRLSHEKQILLAHAGLRIT